MDVDVLRQLAGLEIGEQRKVMAELRIGHQQVSGGPDDCHREANAKAQPANDLLELGARIGHLPAITAASRSSACGAGLAMKARKAWASGPITEGTITYSVLPYG